MAKVKRIRSLKGVGILANKAAKDPVPEFLKVNLVYGFNGSGKSTLSRVFACLQKGHTHTELPEDCLFEIELDDGSIYSAPNKLQGLEERVCVFNTDFVAQNLQWDKGLASSIFYLSQEQADLVDKLRAVEKSLPAKRATLEGAEKTAKASAKAFSTYCTERAKAVHSARHLGTRKYEAPKLKADYLNETFNSSSILKADKLAALQAVVTRTAPPPPIPTIKMSFDEVQLLINNAIDFSEASLGAVILEELEHHPKMVPWVKEGHEYHVQYGLQTCLLCQNPFTDDRRAKLTIALDNRLSKLIADVADTEARAGSLRAAAELNPQTLPKPAEFDPSLQADYGVQLKAYEAAADQVRLLLDKAIHALSRRREQPTQIVAHGLPPLPDVHLAVKTFATTLDGMNSVIAEHNGAVENFARRQEEASVAILHHFLEEGRETYNSAKSTADADETAKATAGAEVSAVEQQIIELKAKVRAHGPAAAKISKLVHDYLGHKELTISAEDKGYSLRRNGKTVKGQPSEGEKTAIALCYFLTTLEAEGRALKDLIVVVDDPISSLDTKAMNYACALVLKHLEKAEQLFVLTHNQHCMNEFKKAWKPVAYPKSKDTVATGRLLFMDVQLSEANSTRTAQIVEMSPLLREYDSEYHFLCHKLLEFEAAGADHSPDLLLMPNAMRRILEIFLAFKVPGSGPIKDKIKSLTERHPELDPVRMTALERLSQVESHSDNLDDLVGHSPMIVEEVRQTCAALLNLMTIADGPHTAAIRKQCKAA